MPADLMASRPVPEVVEVLEVPGAGFQVHVSVKIDGVDECAAAGVQHWVPVVAGHETRERADDAGHTMHSEIKGRAFMPPAECDAFTGPVAFEWTEYKPPVAYTLLQEGLTFDGTNFHVVHRYTRPDGSTYDESEDVAATDTLVCGPMFNGTICEGEFKRVVKKGLRSKETTRYNNRLLELWPEMIRWDVGEHGVFFQPTGRKFYTRKGALPDQPERGAFVVDASCVLLEGDAPAHPVVAEARANMPGAELPAPAAGAGE